MTESWPTAEHGHLIERTDYPSWLQRDEGIDGRAHREVTGEQGNWGAAIPLAYRLLAAPRAHLPYPRPPWSLELRDHSHLPGPATVYWTPLLHLLLYSFGWSRPDAGMSWWADAGRPTNDHRLRLIADLWGADGKLDQFLAWLWTTDYLPGLDRIHQVVGHTPSDRRVEVDEAWLRAVNGDVEANDTPGPYANGSGDPLHLGDHATGPADGDPGGTQLLHSSDKDRRAVLLVDHMTGWYRALAEQGASLPDLGQHSWYVDVVVKPVGHLGTYPLSRETGLWFSGPHSLHVRGV